MTSDNRKVIAPKANARISPEEHELLTQLADEQGITPSEYIRQALKSKMMDDILIQSKLKKNESNQ